MASFPLVRETVNTGLNAPTGFLPVPMTALLVLPKTSQTGNGYSPTQAEINASVGFIWNDDPDALTATNPGMFYADPSVPGTLWVGNAAGDAAVKWMENGIIVATVSLASPLLASNGTVGAPSISFANSATYGRYRVNATTIGEALAGALDFSWTPNSLNVLAGSSVSMANSTSLAWGLDTLSSTGSTFLWAHAALSGDWQLTNADVTHFTIFKGGTATSATGVKFLDSADQVQFSVLNDGSATLDGTLTAGGLATAGTLAINDGGLLIQKGVGTGTGELIQIVGPDSTHGLATYQYEATVSPAAVETALFTVPVMSRITCVQANVESALTGGGTTVTFGIGITGDVDAYGTASNSGVQADLLTKNAKLNAIGSVAANAGASIGVWSAGTVALKLIAAATGGAAAGDTALTAGSVKIRVTYQTLLSIVDAA